MRERLTDEERTRAHFIQRGDSVWTVEVDWPLSWEGEQAEALASALRDFRGRALSLGGTCKGLARNSASFSFEEEEATHEFLEEVKQALYLLAYPIFDNSVALSLHLSSSLMIPLWSS